MWRFYVMCVSYFRYKYHVLSYFLCVKLFCSALRGAAAEAPASLFDLLPPKSRRHLTWRHILSPPGSSLRFSFLGLWRFSLVGALLWGILPYFKNYCSICACKARA